MRGLRVTRLKCRPRGQPEGLKDRGKRQGELGYVRDGLRRLCPGMEEALGSLRLHYLFVAANAQFRYPLRRKG